MSRTLSLILLLALPLVSPLVGAQEVVRFQSVNFPDRYVAHQGSQARILPPQSEAAEAGSRWRIVPGLAGRNTVSLEAVNTPGHYLRHGDFLLRLQRFDGTAQFRQDASFYRRPALTGDGSPAESLEAVNFPGHFVRHQGFVLKLQRNDGSALFRADATFRLTQVQATPAPRPAPAPTPAPGRTGSRPTDTAAIYGPYLLRTGRGGGFLTLRPTGELDDRNNNAGDPAAHWFVEAIAGSDVFRIRNGGTDGYLYGQGGRAQVGTWTGSATYQWRLQRRQFQYPGQPPQLLYRLVNAGSGAFLSLLPSMGLYPPGHPQMQANNQDWFMLDPASGNPVNAEILSARMLAERRRAAEERARQSAMMQVARANAGCYLGTTNPGVEEDWYLLRPKEGGFEMLRINFDSGDARHPGRGWYVAGWDSSFAIQDGSFIDERDGDTFFFHDDPVNPDRGRRLRAQRRSADASADTPNGRTMLYFRVPVSDSLPRQRGRTVWYPCGDGCRKPVTSPPLTPTAEHCQALMAQP